MVVFDQMIQLDGLIFSIYEMDYHLDHIGIVVSMFLFNNNHIFALYEFFFFNKNKFINNINIKII